MDKDMRILKLESKITQLKKKLEVTITALIKRKHQNSLDHHFKDELRKFDEVLYWKIVEKMKKENGRNII